MSETLEINYGAVGLETCVKIIELANLLGVPPRIAAELLLLKKAGEQKERRVA